jgi:hypothetical protein
MADDDHEGQDEVVTSLIDLQSKFRGEDEEPTVLVDVPEAADGEEVAVLVTPDPEDAAEHEDFAPVTTLPLAGAPEPKLLALADRLARIEQEVAQLANRGAAAGDPIVALGQRLLHEVGSQRAQLLREIHERFDRIERTIAEALTDVSRLDASPGDEPEGDEPA